jgi:hypothetical protein
MSRFTGLVCAALVTFSVTTHAAERTSKKDFGSFNTLQAPSEAKARLDAAKWLKDAGKYEAKRQEFDALWADNAKTLLEKVAGTFAMGDAKVAALLESTRDIRTSAPTTLPEILSDNKQSQFFRSNLALSYAKILVNRKVYEEALETMKLYKPEQVVDPASFLFFKAVAEHGLMKKKEAHETIARLLDDVPTAPERYKMVAALMHFDMLGWQDRGVLDKLATIGRKMDSVQRRLELDRLGKATQKQQKEVVMRLDELIKELENMNDGDG